jgi:hypothetical protein
MSGAQPETAKQDGVVVSLNRGRFIIGERPAKDVIQCLRCRRRWEATATDWEPTACLVCNTPWEEPLEWDRSRTMRRAWYVEWRWRDGFAFGPWHNADVVPGTITPDDVQDLMFRFQDAEVRRQARSKGKLRFEYRVISLEMEVYQKDLASGAA